jgi:hypothetical protein
MDHGWHENSEGDRNVTTTFTLGILLLKLTGFVVEDRHVADSRPGVTKWSSPMRHMSPQ